MIEIGYVLPAGTWVAQDRDGYWYAYTERPEIFSCNLWITHPDDINKFLAHRKPNPYWQETLHQIQPGEVIYLSD